MRDDDGWPCDVSAVHETENIHEEPHRNFLIDPQAQFDLMRRLRGGATSIIGCFHSHPDRTAIPSAIDLFSAYENNFIWLIAGTSRSDRPEELQALFLPPYFLHAYCFAGGRFWHLPIQTQTFDEAVKEYFPDDCPFDD